MNSWPLFDLSIKSERLELFVPDDKELDELAKRAVGKILKPEQSHFFQAAEWTQLESPEFESQFLQHFWGNRANWTKEKWCLNLVARYEDELMAGVSMNSTKFLDVKTIETGSWILEDYRGLGLGKELRAAVVSFAFESLGAERMTSSAFKGNKPSNAVSESLGYRKNGIKSVHSVDDTVAYLLDRETWDKKVKPVYPVIIKGFEDSKILFGLDEQE